MAYGIELGEGWVGGGDTELGMSSICIVLRMVSELKQEIFTTLPFYWKYQNGFRILSCAYLGYC